MATLIHLSRNAGTLVCLEHTGVLTQLLREDKESKGDRIVLWLELANAYGSMSHKLVKEALKTQHVPSSIYDLITNYYDNFQLRVSLESTASE